MADIVVGMSAIESLKEDIWHKYSKVHPYIIVFGICSPLPKYFLHKSLIPTKYNDVVV